MKQDYTGYPKELFKMYTTDAMAGRHFSAAANVFLCVPAIAAAVLLAAAVMPEISFFAECVNVPNGDVCSITLK